MTGGDEANGDDRTDEKKGLTYAKAGVDIDASTAATAALVARTGEGEGDFAGLLDIGDQYLGLTTDGVGTKLLVAEALDDYSTVGIDCIAMNANDLVATGVDPIAFVDYLAVTEPDERVAGQLGDGLSIGADRAGVELIGGETAVMPEIVRSLDLAGTCAGIAAPSEVFDGRAERGDALVGWASSGIHSNGLTLAREAISRRWDYSDPCPFGEYDRIGEALLEPTRIYTDLLDPMRDHGVRGAVHITGGGWTNLERLGEYRFDIEDPFPAHEVFEFVQRTGDVEQSEMYRTFNMGTGFVAALKAENADALADATDGRVLGQVRRGTEVSVRGIEL